MSEMERRTFVGAVSAAGLTLSAAQVGLAQDESGAAGGRRVRAAVLEFADRWTKQSVGAAELLRRAGCDVMPLDTTHGPADQGQAIDLLVFGSFTNNDGAYGDYVKKHRQALMDFVHGGGVILEMTQSDQFGNQVSYLPPGMAARRNDDDFGTVFNLALEHPLTGWMGLKTQQLNTADFDRKDANWESFVEWSGMRVLAASQSSGASPALLEGAWGDGRIVLSSLWIDKCFDASGEPTQSEKAVAIGARFFASVAEYVTLVKAGRAPAVEPTAAPRPGATGPMLGHVDADSARLWLRPIEADHVHDAWVCELRGTAGEIFTDVRRLDRDHDFTLHFHVRGLAAKQAYAYHIFPKGESAAWSEQYGTAGTLRTAAPVGKADERVVLGMGSCAPSTPNTVWTKILEEGCEGFVFLGDTPYIDSNQLQVAREKHRRFLSQPEIAEMIRQIPCWGTWDDHDFGRNDGHGDFPGKHICRLAFTEYRANRSFGQTDAGSEQQEPFGEGRGIHTTFGRGPLEVFLLDPRWFSRTEKSWADPTQPTCIGRAQWEWFRERLRRSPAVFKAIATGMIWDDKQNSEKDDWGTYAHEREAIFDLIRDEGISGCFLIGGDIHVSRALNYGPRVGYDLWQFIVSPLHDSTIPSLNVPHPSLVHSAVEPHVFLRLEADTQRLQASWINREGKRIFEVELRADQMS